MKPWWAHRVNETQTDPHSLAKATEHWQPQEMYYIILKYSSADERILSDIFVYKNKHVPCFILIIYSLKYMFCY